LATALCRVVLPVHHAVPLPDAVTIASDR
jgi:hypothetical protein